MPSLHGNHQTKKERFWRNRKNGKDSQKNFYVRIVYVFFCVCVDYINILCLVIDMIVSVCVCMIIDARGRYEVVSLMYVRQKVVEVNRWLGIWTNKIFYCVQ